MAGKGGNKHTKWLHQCTRGKLASDIIRLWVEATVVRLPSQLEMLDRGHMDLIHRVPVV